MPPLRCANSSSSIRAQCTAAAQPGIVTFTWTRPMQTQEIVLPPASPYIVCVIQCLRVTERSSSSSSIQQADRPHSKTWLQTHTHISLLLKWPQVCTWQVCTHTYANTFLPSPVSCQDCLKHTHRSLYIAPLLRPTPHPAQSSHPQGLCVRIRLWTQQPPSLHPFHSG